MTESWIVANLCKSTHVAMMNRPILGMHTPKRYNDRKCMAYNTFVALTLIDCQA